MSAKHPELPTQEQVNTVKRSLAKENPNFVGIYTNPDGKYLDMAALMVAKGYIKKWANN